MIKTSSKILSISFLSLSLFAANSASAQEEQLQSIKLKAGDLVVIKNNDDLTYRIKIKGKTVMKAEDDRILVNGPYYVGSDEMIVVSSECTGSGCTQSALEIYAVEKNGTLSKSVVQKTNSKAANSVHNIIFCATETEKIEAKSGSALKIICGDPDKPKKSNSWVVSNRTITLSN